MTNHWSDKLGRLDPEGMQIMRDHVKIGVRILEPIPCFREALPMVAQHHEWFDGSGYPAGLAGRISVCRLILAVADCYDAIVSDRPYRKGLPKRQALETLRQESGTQFDPDGHRGVRAIGRHWPACVSKGSVPRKSCLEPALQSERT
jgi:HD-GYP domain-containing protein (c-di-GMP phosphodiesterase class II)